MSSSDVFAVTKTADATVYSGRARVRQVQVKTAGSGSPAGCSERWWLKRHNPS